MFLVFTNCSPSSPKPPTHPGSRFLFYVDFALNTENWHKPVLIVQAWNSYWQYKISIYKQQQHTYIIHKPNKNQKMAVNARNVTSYHNNTRQDNGMSRTQSLQCLYVCISNVRCLTRKHGRTLNHLKRPLTKCVV